MTAFRSFSSRLKSAGIAGVAAVVLLTACGDHGAAESSASRGSAAGPGAKANSATQYFFAAGKMRDSDAKLFAAAGTGDVGQVEQAIAAGGNVNATDTLSRTPLFAAAFCNHPQIATLLVEKGGEVDAKDWNGITPLHATIIAGGEETAKALIAKGANINSLNASSRTPLHLAAATDQAALVELLLAHGANPQLRDKDGLTAAALAAANGHPKVAAAIKKWHERPKFSMRN